MRRQLAELAQLGGLVLLAALGWPGYVLLQWGVRQAEEARRVAPQHRAD